MSPLINKLFNFRLLTIWVNDHWLTLDKPAHCPQCGTINTGMTPPLFPLCWLEKGKKKFKEYKILDQYVGKVEGKEGMNFQRLCWSYELLQPLVMNWAWAKEFCGLTMFLSLSLQRPAIWPVSEVWIERDGKWRWQQKRSDFKQRHV